MGKAEQAMRTEESRTITGWEGESTHLVWVSTHEACSPRGAASGIRRHQHLLLGSLRELTCCSFYLILSPWVNRNGNQIRLLPGSKLSNGLKSTHFMVFEGPGPSALGPLKPHPAPVLGPPWSPVLPRALCPASRPGPLPSWGHSLPAPLA